MSTIKTSVRLPEDLNDLINKWVEDHPRMDRTDCIILALEQFLCKS